MKTKTTLSISITYRTIKDIEEVLELSQRIGKGWGQADIYLVGLRTVDSMLKKAKAAVK